MEMSITKILRFDGGTHYLLFCIYIFQNWVFHIFWEMERIPTLYVSCIYILKF